jgi:hypothetical protein
MPIVTKDNTKYLQFGYGDIFVGEAKDSETGMTYGVAFVLSEPRDIGAEWNEVKGLTLDQLDTHVIMQFDKIESLDVVIETLQDIRKTMQMQDNAY